ncbi:MAG: helix-turn-helix domain-containing protein [Chthoniobacteraceae bacterium]
MTSTTTGERLLKTDTRGRVRTPAKRRKALLKEFAGSGLSARKFAALVGVRYSTFAHWVQRFREEGGEIAPVASMPPAQPAEVPMRWMEAIVAGGTAMTAPEPRGLCVRLPGGAQMEIAVPGQVKLAAQLLRALAEGPRPC